jgi:hypothetical protein
MSNQTIDNLTIGQARELARLFGGSEKTPPGTETSALVGKHVIIRTYSAGVWFGVLVEKGGNEVVLADARRLWRWWAAQSISLSGVALYGVKHDKSRIAPPVERIWLEAIEIIPVTPEAKSSLIGAPDAAPK